MKSLSIVFGTLAAVAVAVLAGRYATGHWIFHTVASFQIQGAAAAFLVAGIAVLLHRNVVNLALVTLAFLIGVHGYVMLGAFRESCNTRHEFLQLIGRNK